MSQKGIAALIAELDCEDVIRCQKARRALVAIGHDAVPSLVKALTRRRRIVRWEAAKALAQIGDSSATDALVAALEDKEFDVRWLAAEGLIVIGKQAVAPLLRALIGNPESVWMHEGAHHVLNDMNTRDWDPILRPVIEALAGTEPSLEAPLAARKTLEALKGPATSSTTKRQRH